MLSLLAGKPNLSTFPIRSISMSIRSPVPPFTETMVHIEHDRMNEALQYGPTTGHKDLVNFLVRMQTKLHSREKDASWRLSVGAGSQDLLFKAYTTLTDPGDVVLIEVHAHS
jgi:tryptophan aminotransferase